MVTRIKPWELSHGQTLALNLESRIIADDKPGGIIQNESI